MENTRKLIGLKDVILVTLLTALCIIICTVIVLPFAANIKLVLWVVSGLDMLLCGPIYILMCAKAPRYGAQILFSFLFAVYYYFTNGMIFISLMVFGVGVIKELMMLKNGYRSPVRLTAAHAVFGVGVMMAPVIMIMSTKEQMTAIMLGNGLTQEYVDSMFSVYSAGNLAIGILLTIVGAILGSWIGYRMLRKHFAPAGIVEGE
jgi:energy-coupling factor transport system substrate-specific component